MSNSPRIRVGSFRTHKVSDMAENAALRIIAHRKGARRAVTVDPRQSVHVEPVESALVDDLVGIYSQDRKLTELAAQIEADLMDFYEGKR